MEALSTYTSSFVWYELLSTDVAATKSFYGTRDAQLSSRPQPNHSAARRRRFTVNPASRGGRRVPP